MVLLSSLGLTMKVGAAESVPSSTVTVYMSVSIDGKLKLAAKPVTVPAGGTAEDALKAAHAQYYAEGEAGFHAGADNQYNIYLIDTCWGIKSVPYIIVNDAIIGSGLEKPVSADLYPIGAGDNIIVNIKEEDPTADIPAVALTVEDGNVLVATQWELDFITFTYVDSPMKNGTVLDAETGKVLGKTDNKGKFRITEVPASGVVALDGYAAIHISTTATANPTTSAVLINGTAVPFQAYNIGGSNYFKLRDLGKALAGTPKNFEIGYDDATRAITITTGKVYTPVGGELESSGDTSVQHAYLSKATVYIDGEQAALAAYTIGGYNYFKLRDLAAAVDFGVTYNEETREIGIDTTTGYADNAPESASNPLVGNWYFFAIDQEGNIYTYYLIFSADGSITEFVGVQDALYSADDSQFYEIYNGRGSAYDYDITCENNQTTLYIDAKQYGELVREGVTSETGADVIPGLWLSKLDIFDDEDTYYYFTKDGSVLLGNTYFGEYTVSASDDSFSYNLTNDGSFISSDFVIKEVDGKLLMTVTDEDGYVIIMYKE
jgi:hypothetical protein